MTSSTGGSGGVRCLVSCEWIGDLGVTLSLTTRLARALAGDGVWVTQAPKDRWRRIAQQQAGLVTRSQLSASGIDHWAVAHRIRTERWQQIASNVIATTTGELSVHQQRWAGVLHGGEHALLSGISAAEEAGLQRWSRPEHEVLIPYSAPVPSPMKGIVYRRSRRDTRAMRDRRSELPRCQLEPAVLLFAAGDRSERVAAGLLAAVVQQQLTSPDSLLEWLERLRPLRRSKGMRTVLTEIAGGAQSLGEMDVRRMCRRHRLALPRRQVRRRDSSGRTRFTDCEWRLPDGRTVILEVDGSFHMDVDHWEDDLARQRGLSATDRIIVRCSTRELRDSAESVARDLIALGVPRRL